MHGPVPPLNSRATGRDSRVYSNAAVSPRVVSIHELDFAGVNVRGLQLWQRFLKEFQTITTRKVRVLNQREGRIGFSLDTPVIRDRNRVNTGYVRGQNGEP